MKTTVSDEAREVQWGVHSTDRAGRVETKSFRSCNENQEENDYKCVSSKR